MLDQRKRLTRKWKKEILLIVFLYFGSAVLIGATAGGIVGRVVGAPGTGGSDGGVLGDEQARWWKTSS